MKNVVKKLLKKIFNRPLYDKCGNVNILYPYTAELISQTDFERCIRLLNRPQIILEFDSVENERYGEKYIDRYERGYIYAPYIPLMVTPEIYSEEAVKPKKKLKSRYAKKKINSKYYGVINFNNINPNE